ncbi:MAG: integrase core domain-containing protein [Actinomycetota bacterium]
MDESPLPPGTDQRKPTPESYPHQDRRRAASYSRTGNCFDNAAMESTWATIKREIRHIHGDWSQMTRSQLRTALFAYIETFYNRNRHQARLGHRTPAAVYADHAA